MSKSATVLIIELDEELAELERLILDQEGYRAIPTLCGPDSLRQVQQVNPDVIVLDLGPDTKSCGWQILENLRSTIDTQGIPLLVISDTEKLLEDAKLSFNVRQELFKPYDIEDLVNAVSAAVAGTPLLPHPGPSPTTSKIAVEAAQVISRDAGKMMNKWLNRVQQERVVETNNPVPLRVLMDNISVWMMGLVSALRYGKGYLGMTQIHEKIAEHIKMAQQHGITLAQMIRQFEILRDLVWQSLERGCLSNLTPKDVFGLGRIVNTALTEVMDQVAKQYTT